MAVKLPRLKFWPAIVQRRLPRSLMGRVLLIIVGVQLISIGLIGEMVAKNSLDNRHYSIRETLE